MQKEVSTLLVYDRSEPLEALRLALRSHSIRVQSARTCGEALLMLWSTHPPHLVFTATQLPDGTWADVITLATKAPAPVNVIVVSRLADVKLYLEVIERGAYDFITPPFEPPGLVHVVHCAASNALRRRAPQISARATR